MFMVDARGVQEFVHDFAVLETKGNQGHALGTTDHVHIGRKTTISLGDAS